ncbi:hypothetical protein HaLaN_30032, partial [Haematococcus lacustris]
MRPGSQGGAPYPLEFDYLGLLLNKQQEARLDALRAMLEPALEPDTRHSHQPAAAAPAAGSTAGSAAESGNTWQCRQHSGQQELQQLPHTKAASPDRDCDFDRHSRD